MNTDELNKFERRGEERKWAKFCPSDNESTIVPITT
jgi:hypothetical protein